MPRVAHRPGQWDLHPSASAVLADPRRAFADARLARFIGQGEPGTWVAGGVAVVELRGLLFPGLAAARAARGPFVLGATMLDDLTAELARLAADASVAAILLSVDSPGGMAGGLDVAVAAIARAARSKPVAAHTSGIAAGAAWRLALATGRITAAQGAEIGIGPGTPLAAAEAMAAGVIQAVEPRGRAVAHLAGLANGGVPPAPRGPSHAASLGPPRGRVATLGPPLP